MIDNGLAHYNEIIKEHDWNFVEKYVLKES